MGIESFSIKTKSPTVGTLRRPGDTPILIYYTTNSVKVSSIFLKFPQIIVKKEKQSFFTTLPGQHAGFSTNVPRFTRRLFPLKKLTSFDKPAHPQHNYLQFPGPLGQGKTSIMWLLYVRWNVRLFYEKRFSLRHYFVTYS